MHIQMTTLRTPRHTAILIGTLLSAPLLYTTGCTESQNESEPLIESAPTPTISLEAAIFQGDDRMVQEHIRGGTSIDTPNFTGDTPLSIAAVMGRTTAAKLLIEAGAELETQNQAGVTPLFNAAFFCHADTLELLINAGAETNPVDASGTQIVQIMQTPWAQIQPIYAAIYSSIGMPFDAKRIESTRPQIVDLLQ